MTPDLALAQTKESGPEPLLDALLELDRRDGERRFRDMIDALPAAIYTTDAKGMITHFNPACVEFSGRTPELGTDHWCVTWKLFYPDRRPMPHDECPMAIALKEGRIIRGAEAIAERPDGTRLWLTPYPTPIFDDAGNVIGGINMLVDITERKAAEAQREGELADTRLLQRLSAAMIPQEGNGAVCELIMDAAVAIMRSDFASMQMLYPERGAPGSGGELRLIAFRGFTPQAAKYWEWVRADSESTCGEALRTRPRAIAPDVQQCESMAGSVDLATCLQTGIYAAQSTPLFSRTGELIGMISTHWKAPHQPSERDLRMLDIFARQAADLIERKKADERLAAALEQRTEEVTRAERAMAASQRMAAVGTLASGLAHDMSNVLFPLNVRLDALLTHASVDGATHDHLTAVQGLMVHLREMSSNLSLFARDPSQEGVIGESNLSDWCQRVKRLLESSIRDSGVRLDWDLAADLPLAAIAPHRLTQLVLNLVHNGRNAILARRAQPGGGGGTIRVVARNGLLIDGKPAVFLAVMDDGCGMDEETKRRSIEPFFTTRDRPSVPGTGGGGMGLSLAHSIVERCGGSMKIESAPGQGTTISMTLPIAAAEFGTA